MTLPGEEKRKDKFEGVFEHVVSLILNFLFALGTLTHSVIIL